MTPTDNDALVSLRDYVDKRIDAESKICEARIAGVEKAIDVAHKAMEVRLGTMNEIREQLSDQASRLASKETVDYNGKRISTLEEEVATIRGKDIGRTYLIVLGILTAFTTIVTTAHMLFGK